MVYDFAADTKDRIWFTTFLLHITKFVGMELSYTYTLSHHIDSNTILRP